MTDIDAFLDSVEGHSSFTPFVTSSGDEGFEFSLFVEPREVWIVLTELRPFIEAGEIDLQLSYDSRVGYSYGEVRVEARNKGLVEVGQALISACEKVIVALAQR